MPVYLFHGEDSYSSKQKTAFWQEEFAKKHGGDMNLEIFEGKNLDIAQFQNAVNSMPFLGEKRLVIVKNALSELDKDSQKIIADILPEIPEFCILVFVESKNADSRLTLFHRIQKVGKVEEFTKLTGAKLLSWMFKKCKELNADIDEEAALFLAEYTGGDLSRLGNELHKLGHYAVSQKRPINKEDITLLVDTTLDTSIFHLTDALATKNRKASLRLLHQLLDSGEELHYLFSMIIRQFRIIAQVKELMEQGLRKNIIADKTGLNPYVVSIAMGQAHNFSFDKIRVLYRALLDIDTKLKSGGIKISVGDNREFLLEMDKFIVDTTAAAA